MIIDAHIHFDQYTKEQQQLILNDMLPNKITHLITVSTDLQSCIANLALSQQDDRILPAFGFHPEQLLPDQAAQTKLFDWIRENNEHMVAIGEVGLPYYSNKEKTVCYEPYLELLEKFVVLAAELDKPIVLHAVYEDADQAIELLEKHQLTAAHFHWFKGNPQTVDRMIANGYYISVTPDLLYEEEIQQLVQRYPLEQIMVETDGPWPFEGPFNGQMTHPKMIKATIEKIAEIKQRSVGEVADMLYKNTCRFYPALTGSKTTTSRFREKRKR
ncbi:TatD family hydrolase [Rummeliibacillus suwonensis]|uniref:TatD family hydrolase n=1 Tax=Rummeliibacillus suwonensis TaxID=1306154 RepID=UPI0011B57313|nr:TatD family hydrolase [Rummeliibacillus suwonensis]